MKNKQNVMKLKVNSRNWNIVLLKMLCFQELARRFRRRHWRNGKKVSLWRIKKYISTGFRILLLEIGWQTRRRSWRRRSSWLMVSIWLILSSWRLKIKLWMKRLKKEMKSFISSGRRSRKLWSSFRTLERNYSLSKKRIVSTHLCCKISTKH